MSIGQLMRIQLSKTYSGGVLNSLVVTNAYDAHLRRSAVCFKTQSATLAHPVMILSGNWRGCPGNQWS